MTNAVIVLENPWELDPTDAHRSSVLPFIEGVAKFHEDTRVYYANFYDKKSFSSALDILCKNDFDNIVVYIASHGQKNKLAGSLRVDDALILIGLKSKKFNITGVLIGACFVAKNSSSIEPFTEGTRMRWCAGYSNAIDWLQGTLIDCSILSSMLCLNSEEDFSAHENIIKSFADSIAMFNLDNEVGFDEKEQPASLRDSIKLYTQPKGQGNRARDSSDAVLEHLSSYAEDD